MIPEILKTACQLAGYADPTGLSPLSGGCIGDVFAVQLEDGKKLVAKLGDIGSGLEIEGDMLRYLKGHSSLPVPQVIHSEDSLLLMAYLETSGSLNSQAQLHAAELVADLHNKTWEKFGLPHDTLIGGLHQPNPPTEKWVAFFRDQRLHHMGWEGVSTDQLPTAVFARLEAFLGKLERWIEEPEKPSLIHGDMWTGNVLCNNGKISGFVDPAIYYAHPEIELAFTTMFGTFGDTFFGRYQELRPITPGFFEERLEIYNLYPLLVHVRLFGGSYVRSVESTLSKFGF
ncbi:MAG: fructosamine kinase family protein [Rhodospirillales bacterium]|nr:fructosamine kinase family protein [Rhodospirillales bacterium]